MAKNLLASICLILLSVSLYAKQENGTWQQVAASAIHTGGVQKIYPAQYSVYALDAVALRSILPAAGGALFSLPLPGGGYRAFRVWETPVLPAQLAARYPGIKTYSAVAEDDPAVTAKLDMTEAGFHAMVLDGTNTYFLDPYTNINDGYYLCYYKHDLIRPEGQGMACGMTDKQEDELQQGRLQLTPGGLPQNTPLNKVNGVQKRKYILALACTVEYAAAVGGSTPTKASVMSAMVTSINRVNGVYERELGVTLEFHPNNDTLIFITGDTYNNGNGTSMLGRNQVVTDSLIDPFSYDIGHVFSTGGGGIASLGCVCDFGTKAQGVTGQSNPKGDAFDIDYVAHEMGHQFGATHTFNVNSNAGSCTGNGALFSAYEPGSGSTLMAYAGICGTNNNLQAHSDDYFHAKSLDQINTFITNAGTCSDDLPSGNVPPVVPAFSHQYYIPFRTPFELTAPDAVDADHDQLNYCWEQWNRGDYGKSPADTLEFGPLFRSFKPVPSTTRVFPALDKLVDNITSYVGEKLPAVARDMTFRLTVRDMLNGYGTFNFSDDSIVLHVVNTGTPFSVTAPNAATDYWQIGSNVTVTWDVSSTTSAPISCGNVDIFLSVDNGFTYPYTLVANTPNDGSETITVPNTPTLSARVKVKGAGNVFFDISNANFKINTWPAEIKDTLVKEVQVLPNPVTDELVVNLADKDNHDMVIINTLGQVMWKGAVVKQLKLNVNNWAKGMYLIHMVNTATKEKKVERFIVK